MGQRCNTRYRSNKCILNHIWKSLQEETTCWGYKLVLTYSGSSGRLMLTVKNVKVLERGISWTVECISDVGTVPYMR
jgi:hypothetical protein